jgi:glycosyltransferase involved in cell wall biosynthesis
MASNLMPVAQYDEPLLSICITTYNRSAWLAVTLARVLQLTRSYRDVVEVVVCDNASTDSTPDVVKRCATRDEVRYHRNTENVGMLGNLPITASLARGRFVWLLGDDDVLVEGVIEDVLEGILDYPDIEMIYLNYATTHFAEPEKLLELDDFVRSSTACAAGGTTRRVDRLRYVSTVTENIFTAIYACIFRRDHAVRAFSMARGGAPFTSLRTAAPSAEYVM